MSKFNSPRRHAQSGKGYHHQLRIIAGQWRGRKISLPPVEIEGLRPTSERTRETLFNWLEHQLHAPLQELHALDLFAGSGILGLEALSRGAAHCHFIESDRRAFSHLSKLPSVLDCSSTCTLIKTDALSFIQDRPPQRFDLVFIDPPFLHASWPQVCINQLCANAWLNCDALVYVERAHNTKPIEHSTLQKLRHKTSSGVQYSLLRYIEP